MILSILLSVLTAYAQTTEFTYQGSLQASGSPATGNYDFELALFDAVSGGTHLGSTQTRSGVAVANGVFSFVLDFGGQFPGAGRFLEIRVRPVGGGAFTTLAPRQKITSAPYAVKSLDSESASTAGNALQLGGVAANQYVVTGDTRLSDSRNPLPGSANYIQNQNAAPQPSSNFSISGNGTAGGTLSGNIVSAATQFNIGANRILSNSGTNNLFAGLSAGQSNTTGNFNAFFGRSAGSANTTGGSNAFFGTNAGQANTTGEVNAFFGESSGFSNTTAEHNSFFGASAGYSNTGGFNAFFGAETGAFNTTGQNNSFFGSRAGEGNSLGSGNTLLGANAAVLANNLTNATAIGYRAAVGASNSIVLGSINGFNAATADTNVGIGTTTPSQRLHVVGNGLFTGNLTVNGSFSGSVSAANITGILGPASGGTGLGVSGASGNFLRSNGSAWTSSPLAASDIPSGSSNYVQNQNAAPQASTNFNISGNGQAAIFDAGTQFNLGGNRIIRVASTSNLGVGHGAGQGLTIGTENSFFGKNAGFTNGSGSYNSFFGWSAGYNNLGSNNSFIGRSSGIFNTTGGGNTFLGTETGFYNTTGSGNAFFGWLSGHLNTTGSSNAFFGLEAGYSNTIGTNNTLIGAHTDVSVNSLTNATAIGYGATVGASNSIVLGRSPGVDSVGIGISTPARLLHVNGRARIGSIPLEASTADVCFNAAGDLVQCGASSLKWKSNVRPFDLGLDAVLRLRPINFTWKETGVLDFGLGAEDVAQIAPELTIKDNQGEVKGVKYDRIAVVLINAVKEQQSQLEEQQELIKTQKKQIEKQQTEIDSLRALICAGRVKSAACRAGK